MTPKDRYIQLIETQIGYALLQLRRIALAPEGSSVEAFRRCAEKALSSLREMEVDASRTIKKKSKV